MKTKYRSSVNSHAGEENGQSPLPRYRCNYRDVKHQYKPAVQFINAECADSALEIFIENRRNEGWDTKEIFVDSVLIVIEEETQLRYVLNETGELLPYDEISYL